MGNEKDYKISKLFLFIYFIETEKSDVKRQGTVLCRHKKQLTYTRVSCILKV